MDRLISLDSYMSFRFWSEISWPNWESGRLNEAAGES
jgi:hypothetical protein